MSKAIRVGIADLNVCRIPDTITTLGLGSCIGLVLYDVSTSICGMVHVMLPDSTIMKTLDNPAKFADTGIDELIKKLAQMGIPQRSLMAKMAGGAKMFSISTGSDLLKIGERNIEAVKKILEKKKIPLMASDCGGTYGRTIVFDPATFELHIRAIGMPEKII